MSLKKLLIQQIILGVLIFGPIIFGSPKIVFLWFMIGAPLILVGWGITQLIISPGQDGPPTEGQIAVAKAIRY